MTHDTQLKQAIADRIRAFAGQPLREASLALFETLGYTSDRTVETGSVADFRARFDPQGLLEHPKALIDRWQAAELLFQLTDEELSQTASLFKDDAVRTSLLKSYVFLAVELEAGHYARGKLAGIARRINRVFPMPVMVLFKVGDQLSMAVINRRANKRDEHKDVLGKVTLIRDIVIGQPHPGHLDILATFSLDVLASQHKGIQNFDALHAAWEEVFNVELLNKRFYEELSNWYFWARHEVRFPDDLEPDEATRNATNVIRLITRLIFCWFLKEKRLIPENLFDQGSMADVLTSLDADESTYYHAILQNLFFATLNKPMDGTGNDQRRFAAEGGFQQNRKEHGVKDLYRYQSLFRESDQALNLFTDVPFLNGGLFACLDIADDNGRTQYADGFSRNPKKRPHVPNRLFFAESQRVDLSGNEDFGDAKKKNASVRGLLHILAGYKFTIAESTPVEQEIALEPELLGQVFENLLASYNPETGESARRQTGSFYTPRPIVNYMVDKTLKAHLANALCERLPATSQGDAQTGLDILFAYTEKEHAFTDAEAKALIEAIDAANLLDPACGSGAYPMGLLQKLVMVLAKLDPHNRKWHQRQIDKAERIEDAEARASAIKAINHEFENNELDYGRKLYLIENCIYGVDIQPIAIQIAKLRFFISLICDQPTNDDKSRNRGVRPLPNLETRFVAADSLIALDVSGSNTSMASNNEIKALKAKLADVRHRHFSAQTRTDKERLRKQDEKLRQQILDKLESLGFGSEEERQRVEWNPYSFHTAASFFEPATMFGPRLEHGFDVVIGNPPYVSIQKFDAAHKQAWQAQHYETYAARGDVYCLFYERGVRLLAPQGQLAYITSNKWMRAGYGQGLRNFFSRDVGVNEVIDFGGVVVFNAAVVDTAIVRLGKTEPNETFPAVVLTRNFSLDQSLQDFVQDHAIAFERPADGNASWVVMAPERQRIKEAVEAQGVPLEQWRIRINYGVKTGYNEAFYITSEQRDALIAKDSASRDLIAPLLRGRLVDRYAVHWDDAYQILAKFGSHAYLEERYPAIFAHLSQFEDKLRKRGQCRYSRQSKASGQASYPGQHHWLELDNNPSDEYLDLFQKPKIIYPNMTKRLPFYLDVDDHFYGNQKCFIVTTDTESLHYLIAVLNSSLFRCAFMDEFPNLGEDRRELSKIFVDKIPIKKPDTHQATLFEAVVPLVQAAKARSQATGEAALAVAADFLIDIIDACVMEVYFPEHMAERNLGITAHVRGLLPDNVQTMDETACADAALAFHRTANASDHPVRNILLRIPADSPDWLAVIQREGAV